MERGVRARLFQNHAVGKLGTQLNNTRQREKCAKAWKTSRTGQTLALAVLLVYKFASTFCAVACCVAGLNTNSRGI